MIVPSYLFHCSVIFCCSIFFNFTLKRTKKIAFIRCLNTVVAAVWENNQPIMIKIHPQFFL